MAKTSSVEKNNRRAKMAKQFAAKRAKLKAMAVDDKLTPEDRFEARIKLAELGIMALAAFGFYHASLQVLLGSIFLMGLHSAFLGPLTGGFAIDSFFDVFTELSLDDFHTVINVNLLGPALEMLDRKPFAEHDAREDIAAEGVRADFFEPLCVLELLPRRILRRLAVEIGAGVVAPLRLQRLDQALGRAGAQQVQGGGVHRRTCERGSKATPSRRRSARARLWRWPECRWPARRLPPDIAPPSPLRVISCFGRRRR